MITYLKPKQEYIDRDDRITVDDCRWRENFHNNFRPNDEISKKMPKSVNVVNQIALYYDLLYTTLRWWEDKEKTIQEWMDKDAEEIGF